MSVGCPVKTSIEWITLRDNLGETEAYRVMIANGGLVPSLAVIDKLVGKYNKVNQNMKPVQKRNVVKPKTMLQF